jgi:hypothetical protein
MHETFLFVKADLKRCRADDNACILEVANKILSDGFKGNAVLGLPQIDPMKVDRIDVSQDGGPVTIKANFRNLDLTGLSKAKIYKISGFDSPGKKKLEFQLRAPLASAVGPYKVKGQVLVLPIGGDGIIKLNFSKEIEKLSVAGNN